MKTTKTNEMLEKRRFAVRNRYYEEDMVSVDDTKAIAEKHGLTLKAKTDR